MGYKQIILMRNDLKLPRGKACAQAAHAAVASLWKAQSKDVHKWINEGMPKIVLKVKDEKELVKYFQLAKDKGLPTALITDAGKTVVAPGTKTCIGIGPDEEEKIDTVTGKLPLL